MSDEELDDSKRAVGREEGRTEDEQAAPEAKKGSVLGTAVVVGAGALLAGRVLGGGLLTGIAGVVAGTVAGTALARRRVEGDLEQSADSGVPVVGSDMPTEEVVEPSEEALMERVTEGALEGSAGLEAGAVWGEPASAVEDLSAVEGEAPVAEVERVVEEAVVLEEAAEEKAIVEENVAGEEVVAEEVDFAEEAVVVEEEVVAEEERFAAGERVVEDEVVTEEEGVADEGGFAEGERVVEEETVVGVEEGMEENGMFDAAEAVEVPEGELDEIAVDETDEGVVDSGVGAGVEEVEGGMPVEDEEVTAGAVAEEDSNEAELSNDEDPGVFSALQLLGEASSEPPAATGWEETNTEGEREPEEIAKDASPGLEGAAADLEDEPQAEDDDVADFGEGTAEAVFGFDELGDIYDGAVTSEGDESVEPSAEVWAAEDPDQDPVSDDVAVGVVDDAGDAEDVEPCEEDSGDETAEAAASATDTAVALEEAEDVVDPPDETELTPDEIWEMEALGRFTPAEQFAGSEVESNLDAAPEPAVEEPGKGLFPSRSELVGEDREVALGAGFFASPGAFDDLEEAAGEADGAVGTDEPVAEDATDPAPPEEAATESLPWTSLDVGTTESEPADLGEQKEKFESFFKAVETPMAAPVEERLTESDDGGDVGSEDAESPEEEAISSPFLAVEEPPVAETSFVELVNAKPERRRRAEEPVPRSSLRKLVFVALVVIVMAGVAIVVVSQDLTRPVMNWASAIMSGAGDAEEGVAPIASGNHAENGEPLEGTLGAVVEPGIPEAIEPEAGAETEVIEPGEGGDADVAGGEPMEGGEIEILPALLVEESTGDSDASGEPEPETGLVVAGSGEGDAADENVVPEAIDPADAKSVLMGFLRADTVEQMIATVHTDEQIVSAIRDYYPGGKIPPVKVKDVRLEMSATVPSTDRETHLYLVQLEGEGVGIPVSVENTEDGYRIDWEAYVQCKDRVLSRFAETGNEKGAPRGFYVVLKRSHYFKDDVPGLDEKHCFHLTSPLPGDPGVYVFADKLSEEGRKLATDTRWGALYFPVVRLSRVENPEGDPYLMLIDVVREQWRSN